MLTQIEKKIKIVPERQRLLSRWVMELAAFLQDEHDMSKSSAMGLAHLTRELLQRLGEGRVWFEYRKEDGTIREAVGTLCPGISDKFDSYEVKALDFLLKPIQYNKFFAAVEKAKEWFSVYSLKYKDDNSTIFLKVDGEYCQIAVSNILYVCGMKDYVMFYLDSQPKPLITHLTMKSVEDMLPSQQFMRVHRSYIVALDKIRKVDRNDCIYIGNEIIHVTEAYLSAFHQYFASKFPGRS